jgi:uncharacterized protein YjbJ (UPF0337 family)
MNKDRIKGIIDEVAGSVRRKAGELTDNPKLEAEGGIQQAKGKVEGAWGKAKDGLQNVLADTELRLDAHVELGVNNPTADATLRDCK